LISHGFLEPVQHDAGGVRFGSSAIPVSQDHYPVQALVVVQPQGDVLLGLIPPSPSAPPFMVS
jgi:hypothetical protein